MAAGAEVTLDAGGSDTGPGEPSQLPLTYQWTVEGDAVIVSDADEAKLIVKAGSPVGDGEAICRVAVDDGQCARPAPAFAEHRIRVIGLPPTWLTYDANNDAALNITDAVNHLNFLFGGGQAPPCQEAMDFDGDGTRNISDPISALNFLFAGGDPPAVGEGCQPQPACGVGASCTQ